MASDLVFRVDDLIGHPERVRSFTGQRQVSLRLGESEVVGPINVVGQVAGTIDGVHATFVSTAEVNLVCVRCLAKWPETLEVAGDQHFSKIPDEDGYAIVGGEIDLNGPTTDELGLGIPVAPLCRSDCLGLCPICGTDLNMEPCDGHGGDPDSPFAVLKDLF